MRPAYKLKNCRERLARYSNHLMFLTKFRTHGIIPQGLRVILPVRSTKVDTIAERPSHALVRERIGKVHRHKEMLARRIMWLETDLSQTLDTDARPRITCARVPRIVSTNDRQIRKFSTCKSQGTPSQPMLETSKLVMNLSHRQLYHHWKKRYWHLDCPLQLPPEVFLLRTSLQQRSC